MHEFKGLDFGVVHFIGHSLGAHVSGIAAKHLPGRITRITGRVFLKKHLFFS